MKINEIVWDPSIYPRINKWSTQTIERYAEAIDSGDEFPPITVEKETNKLLDGKHRLEAYKKAGVEDVPVKVVVVPEGTPAKLYAASLSSRHGDRLSNGDLKQVCREIYTENPDYKQDHVAKMLGITQQRVSEFVGDITAKRKEERRAKALRLYRLGWTQAETAERLGVTDRTVRDDTGNSTESGIFSSGHNPEEIARRLGWPVQLVHAHMLDDKDDAEKTKHLGIKMQPYDVWHFQGCHDLMGDKHPGRIPGELICHVLWYWTNPGDLVVDPMAGSGTTLDACLLMGRKCRGYDIDLHHNRIDIEEHDLSSGWPEKTKKADLIFWDPPYFDKMDKDYVEGSISGLSPDEYLEWLKEKFTELASVVKKGTRFVFLMSDWDPENAKKYADHKGLFVWDYAYLLQQAGWQIERQVQVPLSTQQVHPDIVNKFRDARRMARLGRYLLEARYE